MLGTSPPPPPPPSTAAPQDAQEVRRRVFTTHLHHQLQTVARSREVSDDVRTSPVEFPPRPTDVNGWEVERKMALLQELRPLLEQPSFLYIDCGARRSTGATASADSHGSFFSIESYFHKTLPLSTGQHSLLDVWEYLLDMSDYVPIRNRCRSLYLHCAVCVCRRTEFIDRCSIEGDPVVVDESVQERYNHLLLRSVALSSRKLSLSRILAEENALFVAHIFTIVWFRFPSRSERFYDSLTQCTRVLAVEDSPRPPRGSTTKQSTQPTVENRRRAQSDPVAVESKGVQSLEQIRGPQLTQHVWNALDVQVERRSSYELRADECEKAVLAAFSRYKTASYRRQESTPQHVPPVAASPRRRAHSRFRRTAQSMLDTALQADMNGRDDHTITPREVAFIRQLPFLYAFNLTQCHILRHEPSRAVLDRGVSLFLERLEKPERDDLLVVAFVGAYLSDASYWCRAIKNEDVLWHCIPGYTTVIRAFAAVFQRMCQRRPRSVTGTSLASIGNILAIVDGKTSVDLWTSYWTNSEVSYVMDTLSEVLHNHQLINPFVAFVLEGTNILDPASVNYSFSVLQRVMEVASMASRKIEAQPDPQFTKRDSASSSLSRRRQHQKITNGVNPSRRECLPDCFDHEFFGSALHKALESSHVQTLLKTLTFLYNCIDLLPPAGRRRIVSELIIRENFFQLLLHWNEEIRKIYAYIIVFKIFSSSRLDLPCMSDRMLLACSPFFHSTSSGGINTLSPSSPSFGYWNHLTDIAQSMLKSPTSTSIRDEQRRKATTQGLERLVSWDASSTIHGDRAPRRESLFRASLDNEDVSVDLLVSSKIDTSFKMLADQMKHRPQLGQPHASRHFPVELEAYSERAIAQYVDVLWEYYSLALDQLGERPIAPKLEFTISSPFQQAG
ncbi:hypothetical protein PINS_up002421 [Pythium insidiosum]|nr:hypothetical protein PINS_up002421 [Pythium insidiosum]